MSLLITIALGTLIIISLIAITTNSGNFSSGNTPFTDNSTIYDVEIENVSTFVYIDDYTGAIIILTIFVALAFLFGIRIFNSGLSDSAMRIIMHLIFYIGIWTVFSALSYDLIVNIDLVGTFIYVFLTIIYTIGVFQKIQEA